jgi:hypothetical protein
MNNLIILAIYIGLGNVMPGNKYAYMEHAAKTFPSAITNNGLTIRHYIFPTEETGSRIECVYPTYITDEEATAGINEKLKEFLESVDEHG